MGAWYKFPLLLCITLCHGQRAKSYVPPQCAAVLCEDTFCPNPIRGPNDCCDRCLQDCRVVFCGGPPSGCETYIPPGECCPVCRPRQCAVGDGRYINEGESIKVDCNTCSCRDGELVCTLIACEPKPGTCPSHRGGLGSCVHECTTDSGCPGQQKCCSTGCGHVCRPPVIGPIPPDCSSLLCPPVRPNCHRLYRPGSCCPVCRSTGYGHPRRSRRRNRYQTTG